MCSEKFLWVRQIVSSRGPRIGYHSARVMVAMGLLRLLVVPRLVVTRLVVTRLVVTRLVVTRHVVTRHVVTRHERLQKEC